MSDNIKAVLSSLGLFALLCFSAVLNAAEESDEQSKQQQAQPKIEETVLGMNVSGNKELPNVLYIVPWKSDATPAPLPEVKRLVDEIYAPVDPEVFTKQVKFYQQLTQKKAPQALDLEAND